MKPTGAAAVMADRARGEVAADSAAMALYRKLGFFPTPPWAARAGGELIARLDPGAWDCWEPACGQGHMAHGLADYFAGVYATDIHAHGWSGQSGPAVDFLHPAMDMVAADWIVTNPPFHLAAAFVEAGLRRARRGVAVLCRLSFLEAGARYPLFFGETPLSVFAPFYERPAMHLGRWDPKGSTATGYAWFVWVKPETGWDFEGARIAPIPPATRRRLTRPGDALLFGVKGDAPLFGEAGDVA
jgi:hypothetical protein